LAKALAGSGPVAGNTAGKVTTLKRHRPAARSRSMSRWSISGARASIAGNVAASRPGFRCLPVKDISDITSPSRNGSMGVGYLCEELLEVTE
jgi:hypothetical protein